MDLLKDYYSTMPIYTEACQEAEDIVSSWMAKKECSELTGYDLDCNDILTDVTEQPVSDCEEFARGESSSISANILTDSNESEVVMQHLYDCLSFEGKDLLKEKKKALKPTFSRPILTMEMRHQQVKEARRKRAEKAEKRHNANLQKAELQKVAEDIMRQEEKEKQLRHKIEEEAILQEMAKIRKTVQDQKKLVLITKPKHGVPPLDDPQLKPEINFHSRNTVSRKETNMKIEVFVHKLIKRKRLQLQQKCFSGWFKTVLNRNAQMGKAKALSDWNLLMNAWNGWQKFSMVQVSKRSTKIHETNMKQTKLQGHLAVVKYNKVIMRKCLHAWIEFVKTSNYCKDLWQERESTKLKMQALLGAVAEKKKPVEHDLVVENFEDGDSEVGSVIEETPRKFSSKEIKTKPQSKPAWQVTKADVRKLSKKSMLNLQANFQKNDHKQSNITVENAVSKTMVSPMEHQYNHPLQVVELNTADRNARTQKQKNDIVSVRSPKVIPHKKMLDQKPKMLTEMEKRAIERTTRRQEMKRLRQEKERVKMEQEAKEEEERIEWEKEEKRHKAAEMRRAKQKKEQEELERKQFQIHMQNMRKKADAHFIRTTLRRRGLEPWKLFIVQIHKQASDASTFWQRNTVQHSLQIWHTNYKKSRSRKEEIAELYNYKLTLKRCFHQWLSYREIISIQEKKADIQCFFVVKQKYLKHWKSFTTSEQLEGFKREDMAVQHNKLRLLKIGFDMFLHHHRNLEREKERSRHVSDLRRKVAQLLPDFCPGNESL